MPTGSRRRRLAAVLAAVEDLLAGHVHGFEASAGVELVDHVKHVLLAQPALVKLHEFVGSAGVDEASGSDGADVLDVVLRVSPGHVAQRLKLGVHVKCVSMLKSSGQ